MDQYKPSDFIRNATDLDPMPGFGTLIRSATSQGIIVTVDWEDGFDDSAMQVTAQTARYAAHEDVAIFSFYKDGEHLGSMLVIPNNGGEHGWLSDYHVGLEKVLTFPSY